VECDAFLQILTLLTTDKKECYGAHCFRDFPFLAEALIHFKVRYCSHERSVIILGELPSLLGPGFTYEKSVKYRHVLDGCSMVNEVVAKSDGNLRQAVRCNPPVIAMKDEDYFLGS
jgi:hypothetical protein